MAEYILNAKKREISTKGYLNQLRKDGMVPAVFYIKEQEPVNLYIEEVKLNPLVFTSETHLITLDIEGGSKVKCIIKDIQFDPVSDRVIHVDFHGITVGEELELEVPVNLIGSAVGIKSGGVLQEALHKLQIGCLPRHIPESIDIDITNLEIGDSILARDIKIENLTVLNPEDALIVAVQKPKAEETEGEEEEETDNEPEVITKGKAEDAD